MSEDKTYIAIDLKSFYASVECNERGLDPMTANLVVADSSRTQKTICLAVSPALKQYGIPGRPRLFEVVQKVGEANAARRSKAPNRRFTGRSCDADGVRIAELDEMSYRRQLWHHRPITDFWRVGKGYARSLEKVGIYTMGDIAKCSTGDVNGYYNEALLYELFGVNAELLIDHAWGWEPCTIADIKAYRPEENSISSGQVLPCPYDFEKDDRADGQNEDSDRTDRGAGDAFGKDGKGIEICCCLCYTTGIDENGSDGDWNTDLTDNAKTEGAWKWRRYGLSACPSFRRRFFPGMQKIKKRFHGGQTQRRIMYGSRKSCCSRRERRR